MSAPALPHPTQPGSTRQAVDRYFDTSLYLMIVTAFATLASTGKLDLVWTLIVTLALMARGYLLWRGQQVTISERWTDYLTVFYVLFYLLDFFLLSGSFLTATVHLVLFITVVKIFAIHRARDIIWLCAMAFGAVLGSAVLTVDTVFLAAFSLFLLLSVTTFISWEMKRSAATAQGCAREPHHGPRRMAWSLSTTAALLMVTIILGATGIFFMLPRVSAGYLSRYAPRSQFTSGFSDDVRLGEIGEIQQSTQVVMHIQIQGDTLGAYDLKWRGVALEAFDGKRWFNPTRRLPLMLNRFGSFDVGGFTRRLPEFHAPVTAGSAPQRIRYRVTLEPIGTHVFFLAPVVQMLYGNYREVTVDYSGSVFNNDRDRVVSRYEAISDVARPNPENLRAAVAGDTAGTSQSSLRLPKLDPRIAELARQVTQNATNDYDRAAAIESYLTTRYGYTLQLLDAPEADPLAHFLFVRKQGHCEYFSSAMAVMLRTLNIPSRIVNGFRGGEFNDVTGSYIVRARDAHSWVEAWFPGHGWVSFDPTPASSEVRTGAWKRFLLYVDAASEFWREWVINYDFAHQNQLGRDMTLSSRRYALDLSDWFRERYRRLVRAAREAQKQAVESPLEWSLGTVVGLASIVLLVNLRRLWRAFQEGRTARRPERAPRAAATIWYERMIRSLGRRGWHKRPSQTPEEFTLTIDDPALSAAVERFTQRYQRARFGDSSEDAGALPELFEQVTAHPSK
ncbi:MAG: transglutaminase TgpA family protein [Terriglobales bacterium]